MTLFEKYFHLRDHPFAPDDGRDVSPEKPLNVFASGEQSIPYFARVAAFERALTDIEQFFAEKSRTLHRGKPPALLILGPSGSGRNTVAAFAAHLLRLRCAEEQAPSPNFTDLGAITSEDYARLLDDMKSVVLDHLTAQGIQWDSTVNAVGPMNPDAPNQAQLERFYKNLARKNLDTIAVNALAIGPITVRRESWMLNLRLLLAPLRVLPIFLTDDPTVATTFDNTADQSPRQSVEILELALDDAVMLLRQRFLLLESRDRGERVIDALFPYSDDLIRRLFPNRQRAGIKYFISVCNAAFDAKLSRLKKFDRSNDPPQPDPRLTWDDLQKAIRDAPKGGREA